MRWGLMFKAIGMVVGWVLGIALAFTLIAWLCSLVPEEWVPFGIVASTVGAFIVVMTIGVYNNLKYEEDRKRFQDLPSIRVE